MKYLSGLDALLLFVPAAIYLEYARPDAHTAIFFTCCLAIVPLAAWLGKSTEQIADRAGESVGGLFNAVFGNAAELIIAGVALKAGQLDIVKASLTGSIISNILLVLGGSFLAGGLRHKVQTYNTSATRAQTQMLLLTSVALIIPGLFHAFRPPDVEINEKGLSLGIAALLILMYVLYLLFSLRTHRDFLRGEKPAGHEAATARWSLSVALGVLVAATVGIAFVSEMMVGSVEQAASQIGMPKVFVGIVILSMVGSAAEQSSAISAALKNRMDLSVSIAIGSATLIALFVTPVLVFLSYLIAPAPMDLVFSSGETFAVVVSASIAAHMMSDGRSTWFAGALLLSLYLVLAVGFFHVPG